MRGLPSEKASPGTLPGPFCSVDWKHLHIPIFWSYHVQHRTCSVTYWSEYVPLSNYQSFMLEVEGELPQENCKHFPGGVPFCLCPPKTSFPKHSPNGDDIFPIPHMEIVN